MKFSLKARWAAWLSALAIVLASSHTHNSNPRGKATAESPKTVPELEPYLEFLRDPLPGISSQRREIEQMLHTYSPRLWLHPKEKYLPTDPSHFLAQSSLWIRGLWGLARKIVQRGSVEASELGFGSTGAYLRLAGLELRQPASVFFQQRIFDPFYLKHEPRTDEASHEILSDTPPVFWKLGSEALMKELQPIDSPPRRKRILVEYWFHYPYSYATSIGIGNHQGDWEGIAALIELEATPKGALSHRLLAAYYAAHEGGTWHCATETNRRPEAFVALGTHATYFREGTHRSSFLPDVTSRGRLWETWRSLRPIAREPFFGYSGGWGEASWLSFMSGPLAPGPDFKNLPKDPSGTIEALSRCGIL